MGAERPNNAAAYRTWKRAAGTPAGPPVEDAVAVEEPMEIRVAGKSVGITMRTPGGPHHDGTREDEELALGFLVGEGVIASPADVTHVRRCDKAGHAGVGDVVDVLVSPGVAVDFARLTRHVFASSSCGICGSATIAAVMDRLGSSQRPAAEGPVVTGEQLLKMVAQLRASQPGFDATGGLHGAALFAVDAKTPQLVAAREDVGRHNAVDKVVGFALRAGMLPLRSSALVVSGRVSFEIVQKAMAAGISLVAAVSAPSSLAIDLADSAGITLVGFLRAGADGGGRYNVYTHPRRIA